MLIISKIPDPKMETLRYDCCFLIHFTSKLPQLDRGLSYHYWKKLQNCCSGNWCQVLTSEWGSSFPRLHLSFVLQSFSVFLSHFAYFFQLISMMNHYKCSFRLLRTSITAFSLKSIYRILIGYERQELWCEETDFWRTGNFTFRWGTKLRIQGQESRFMNLTFSLAWNTWVYCWDLDWFHHMYHKRCLRLRLP